MRSFENLFELQQRKNTESIYVIDNLKDMGDDVLLVVFHGMDVAWFV